MAAFIQVKYVRGPAGWFYEVLSDGYYLAQSGDAVQSLEEARELAQGVLPTLGYDVIDATNQDIKLMGWVDTVIDFLLVIPRDESSARWL